MTTSVFAKLQSLSSWTDLAYFAAIARTGGLQPAADDLGVSVATLSRRMRAFEAQLECRLFLHGKDGYRLTADGRYLATQAQRMERVAADIARWRDARAGPVCVRLSAGSWTARHLAQHMDLIWHPGDPWVPEFVTSEREMDVARREVDIGIRNARPTQSWLAGRRVSDVTFAVYARDAEITGWIGPALGAPDTPSARWVRATHGDAYVTKANTPEIAAALAQAGVGRVVLPTFAGDAMPGLARIGPVIDALTSEQWLISHHESRHEPAIRSALEACARFLTRRGSDR